MASALISWPLRSALYFLFFISIAFNNASASDGKILVFKPQGEAFDEVVKGLEEDIDEELDVAVITADKSLSAESFNSGIAKHDPNVLVLLGNRSVQKYSEYQKANPNKPHPPAIATAALFVDYSMPSLKNTSAIRYEVPAVTSIINIRDILNKDVKKVGLLYRESLKDIVANYEAYCKAEGVELVTVELPNSDKRMARRISKSLKKVLKEDIDAMLVLNDNALLTSDNVRKAWLPVLAKKRIPVIVGINSLLKSSLKLGSFSFAPDHYGLGIQTASMIWELLDNDWEFEEVTVQEPLSVKKTINTEVLDKKRIRFEEKGLGSFDTVIKK